jgi:choline dehydrogenase
MVYLRGAQSDFDAWEADGCAAWGWRQVEVSYTQMEKLLQPRVVDEHNELSNVFIQAALESGHAFNASFDSGKLMGCGWNRSTIHQGRRHSSYRAFLHPVIERSNLTVFLNTNVERLMISPTGAVTGVTCRTDQGRSVGLFATEVILCAGAYESPRVLLASGVGPAAELARHSISSVIDLPVGENLQDHLLIGLVYTSPRPISPLHSSVTECCAFTRSSSASDICDIEISFAKESLFAPDADDGVARYTIIPGVTRLVSRGSVRLAPPNSDERLIIDHAYFSEPEDMVTMIEAVRLSRDIGHADAFGDWREDEYFPGPCRGI